MDMPGMPDTGHGHHGDGGVVCDMEMLVNWKTTNVCILTSVWHVNGPFQLLLSCIMIGIVASAYEGLRYWGREYDVALLAEGLQEIKDSHRDDEVGRARAVEEDSLLSGWQAMVRLSTSARVTRACIYAIQIAVSFLLMLIFMTYNLYLMLAVVVGAAVGHYMWGEKELKVGGSAGGRGMQCH